MTHNDVLRRIRYVFDFGDSKMIEVFALGGREVTRTEVCDWLKSEHDPDEEPCDDATLASFLNGLIVEKRGRREGPQPVAETQLDNNAIFRKLKIALHLQAEEVLRILALGGAQISKHELSAFFRKPSHKHHRQCQDQILRKFLRGLQLEHRGGAQDEDAAPAVEQETTGAE
ncbi:MAG: DUF1456 family protein [Deltaproteobacteria bacterium]|nr:DUF1456 family protein [Deltaproteobacteria bacterium]